MTCGLDDAVRVILMKHGIRFLSTSTAIDFCLDKEKRDFGQQQLHATI